MSETTTLPPVDVAVLEADARASLGLPDGGTLRGAASSPPSLSRSAAVERTVNGWLTIGEVAEALRVDPRTVRRWIATGDPSLEVLRIGGIVRIQLRNVRECPLLPSHANFTERTVKRRLQS